MAESAGELCNWTGCGKQAGTKIEKRAFCLEHFLEFSHSRVSNIQQGVAGGAAERNLSPEVQSFLSEVIAQTTRLAAGMRLLAPMQRDHLIALSTEAAELYRRIHRMPRVMRRIACRARTGTSANDTSELCFTVNISQRGACLEMKQQVKAGQTVRLERVDTPGRTAQGRVVWIKPSVMERYSVGVEIVDQEDFWGLGKAAGA